MLQFRQTIRPVKDSRSSDSSVFRAKAIRSIKERRVGAERRMESRMCVPTGDWVSMGMASGAARRLLRSLRRKVRFDDCGVDEEKEFEMGFNETCRMCDVLVHSARESKDFGESDRRPS